MLLEICVDSAEGLEAAIRGGADRIELCSALELGGLTPSPGLMAQAAQTNIPIYAMVRPRAGNFVYSESELQSMELDIDAVHRGGLAGVVFGANCANGQLDESALSRLAGRAKKQGLGTTLHRCFDLVPDLKEAVELAIKLGIERILTSGRSVRAIPDGLADLAKTAQIAAGRISIIAGSGICAENVEQLLKAVPSIQEAHSSCSILEEMKEANASKLLKFGFVLGTGRKKTNQEQVRNLKNHLLTI